jgi:hypothetical protein
MENDASNSSYTVAYVFVVAATFLPSRFLATVGDTRTDTETDAAEMGSRVMIYIPSFITIRSGFQKLIGVAV